VHKSQVKSSQLESSPVESSGVESRHVTMMVFELPPSADCRIWVSFESRYGMKTFFLGLLAAHSKVFTAVW
jgi:hypothetical protein